MIPASFPESNHVLGKPPGMTHEECQALSVYSGETQDGVPVTISCWKLTKEEIETLIKTGRVWLWIFGRGMPPVSLNINSPFPQNENSDSKPGAADSEPTSGPTATD